MSDFNLPKRKNTHVRFPIGAKLAIIIGIIVLVSLGTVTFLNSWFIGQDVKITAENNNLSINIRASGIVNTKLTTIRSNVFQLLDLLNVVGSGKNAAISKQAEVFFFERNQDIAAIYVLSEDSLSRNTGTDIKILNNRFFISNEIDVKSVPLFLNESLEDIARSCRGETIAMNASPFFNIPVMALLYPWKENGREQTCIIIFSIESISEILGISSINTTFIVNDSDELLCHPDTNKIIMGESFKNHPLIVEMRKNNENNDDSRQIPFFENGQFGNKIHFFGAYQKIATGDIVVLTTVPLDTILEAVRITMKNNIYLTAAVLFLSIILILLFSRYTLSIPLGKLTSAAAEIESGNFDTDIISRLNTKRLDEIGILNIATQNEREFLNTFARFTNKGVAKAIARKEIDFEPHLKDLTIFFSDIRGFTAISDGFKRKFGEQSAAEIIGFLNDYMSRMVNCVTLSHGNIDKFEGDAIMALWGIMRDDDLSYEKLPPDSPDKIKLKRQHIAHVKEDAVNCIKGTIAMRYALMEYNKAAEAFTKAHENEPYAKYKPHICIGCGINTGRVTAGIMGSEDKMEYTAIGDAVNFASRTESSNKPCGTDILITQDTYNLLKNDFIKNPDNGFTIKEENKENEIIVEKIPAGFEVKGKGIQYFYGVVNMPQFNIEKFFKAGDPNFKADKDCIKAIGPDGPRTLDEVRAMLGIQKPDFGEVNLNAEESKIQIKK